MERDMELVRKILLELEKQEDFRDEFEMPDEDRIKVAYHLKIMEQAGLVEQKVEYAANEPMWMYASITWLGHEFLDSVRNENIWNKAKDLVKTKGLELSSVSFDVLKEFAKMLIKQKLGLQD